MTSSSDKTISVFSKEGKLYQVEYSFTAVKNAGFTAVGVTSKDSVVVVIERKVPVVL